jgi:uridine kinase
MLVIGIAGGTGSGKTTVVRKIMERLPVDEVAIERLMRVIQRDIEERGRTIERVLNRYQKTVKPMHLQFIEPCKRYADLIVPQGGENHVAIDILTHFIQRNLS